MLGSLLMLGGVLLHMAESHGHQHDALAHENAHVPDAHHLHRH